MSEWIQTTGTIHYSPKLLGAGSKWWIVAWCDIGIVKYYRHLHHISTHRCWKLEKPAWESHITIVRDEEPPQKELWGVHEGAEFELFYSPNAETNGDYWWLPVRSESLLQLREKLGLSRNPLYDLHLSFGHGQL